MENCQSFFTTAFTTTHVLRSRGASPASPGQVISRARRSINLPNNAELHHADEVKAKVHTNYVLAQNEKLALPAASPCPSSPK